MQASASYDRPVPRYTSYPTAAQFEPSVGPALHHEWLNALEGHLATLYLHVPFCQQLCWYCACHTGAMNRPGTLDRYSDALCAELDGLSARAPSLVLEGVQWGGGTPSHLGPERMRRIGRKILCLFDRRCDAEFSMEIDPRYCDPATVEAIAAIGVSRISLGVQDFDPGVQAAINRRQSFEDTAAVLARFRAASITRVNLDLVYGLPRQTLATLAETLRQALLLCPDRLAVFGYAHVPWMKPHQKLIDASTLPDYTTRAAMAALVTRVLTEAGYHRIGLDHYARPGDRLANAARDGTLHRSFQGYVADRTSVVVGIGASAISSFPQGFSQNATEPAEYMRRILGGGLATSRGLQLNRDDQLRGAIIQRIMCDGAAEIGTLCREHRVDADAFLSAIDLDAMKRNGLLQLHAGRLSVTDKGRPLMRFICAAFDRHYAGNEQRHSRGI